MLPLDPNTQRDVILDSWLAWVDSRRVAPTPFEEPDSEVTSAAMVVESSVQKSSKSDNRKITSSSAEALNPKVIAHFTSRDVLAGRRTKEFSVHPGNLRLRQLVAQNLPVYEASRNRKDKTALSQAIVNEIQKSGGRFLKVIEGITDGWEELDDEAARDKVSHAFRNQRRISGTDNAESR